MTDLDEGAASRNDEFDIGRSPCILPARTSVFAYLDDYGDLWISASDAALRCDTEFRIAADDVFAFVDRLTELVGIPSVGKAAPTAKAAPKARTANAERQRRYRENKRNDVTPVTPAVTRDVTPVTRDVTRDDDQPALNLGVR
jgi:hypothetical protein